MFGNTISLLSGASLMVSVFMIVAAIYLFWVDMGNNRLAKYARKISVFLGALGWALILLTLMPVT